MATITSAQSGNFTSTTTWVGGVVPGPADSAVAAAGHIIAIDANVTVLEIRTANTSGYFTLGNGRTLTGNVKGGSTAANNATLIVTATTSATIIGDIVNDQATTSAVVVIPSSAATGGTLNVQGSVTGGGGAGRHAINIPVGNTLNGFTINITGAVNSGAASTAGAGVQLDAGTNINVNITGNVGLVNQTTAVSIAGTSNRLTINGITRATNNTGQNTVNFSSTNGIATITGDLIGSATSASAAFAITGTNATATITGNCSLSAGIGYALYVGAGCTVSLNGNVAAGTGSQTVVVLGTLTVDGSVTAGTTSGTGIAIATTASTGSVIVVGPVTAATGSATGAAMTLISGSKALVTGTVTATNNSSAIVGSGAVTGTLILAGSSVASANGRSPYVLDFVRFLSPASESIGITSFEGYDALGAFANGVNLTMVSTANLDYPLESHVRQGTEYATGVYTGTLIVPGPESVAYGVLVDDTVGTAALNQAAVVAIIGAQIAAAVSSPSV